ncbi:MAG TPA: hypothetical protein VF064_10225 [Pyrinomonadaceae bacterium]
MKRVLCSVLLVLALWGGVRGQERAAAARGGEAVDRMVAVINGRELITFTDLLWQLALEPRVPLDNPRQEDINRALDLVINQRLIAQEAEKLPTVAPTEDEVRAELARLINFFPSQAAFYERLNRVGLGESSARLREIVEGRVRINKYIDFRFRSFTVVTPQEVAAYYRDVYVPRFRRQSPGRIVPTAEEVYREIERELTDSKIESDTDEFLEEARSSAEITILD